MNASVPISELLPGTRAPISMSLPIRDWALASSTNRSYTRQSNQKNVLQEQELTRKILEPNRRRQDEWIPLHASVISPTINQEKLHLIIIQITHFSHNLEDSYLTAANECICYEMQLQHKIGSFCMQFPPRDAKHDGLQFQEPVD